MPRVSVIIPCFNHGAFIDEAVDSVLRQTYRDIEIIIVDDGSDDGETREKLQTYERPSVRVIFTSNRGASAARNTAIAHANGEYILPLDADDLIGETYIEEAVRVMDSDGDIGIVYCEAEFFGEKTGAWDSPEYSFDSILLQNMIFCSALMRKNDLEQVGGYNINMTSGYEDWDLLLSLIGLGRKVYRIPETLFFYRIREGSRTAKMTNSNRVAMHLKMMENHKELYSQNLSLWAKPLLETWVSIDDYLMNSWSWRLTAPLRKGMDLFGAYTRAVRRLRRHWRGHGGGPCEERSRGKPDRQAGDFPPVPHKRLRND
jgi:glycosyltransferase involved in cell wall biosynthesis